MNFRNAIHSVPWEYFRCKWEKKKFHNFLYACLLFNNKYLNMFFSQKPLQENEYIPTYVIAGKNDFIFREKKKFFRP